MTKSFLIKEAIARGEVTPCPSREMVSARAVVSRLDQLHGVEMGPAGKARADDCDHGVDGCLRR
jgi:hypothetical protein